MLRVLCMKDWMHVTLYHLGVRLDEWWRKMLCDGDASTASDSGAERLRTQSGHRHAFTINLKIFIQKKPTPSHATHQASNTT